MRLIYRGRLALGRRRGTSPLSLRQAREVVRQNFAERELRRVSLLGTAGVAREIAREIRREHREETSRDREIVRDVRGRGGVCRPTELSKEEFEGRVPRSLRGRARRCVPPDELAQEFFDRGMIADPSTDVVIDFLEESFRRARSPADVPEERELRREARGIVRERVGRAIRELVKTARRQGEAACPPPAAAATLRVPA